MSQPKAKVHTATTKKPIVHIDQQSEHVPGRGDMTLTEEERVAQDALRKGAKITGAITVTGAVVIGQRVDGGLDNVQLITMQPMQVAPNQPPQARIALMPFIPPLFDHNVGRPEIGDRFLVDTYEVKDPLADHYMDVIGISIRAQKMREQSAPAEK